MSRRYHYVRHDYWTVYEAGGPAALNNTLRERYPDLEVRATEIQRMAKTRFWEIAWNEIEGCYTVVKRLLR